MDLKAMDAYSSRDELIQALSKKIMDDAPKYHGCGQIVVQSYMDVMGVENLLLTKASGPLFAGLAMTGKTCGALLGALMMLGMVFGREDISKGVPGLLEHAKPMRKLIKNFVAKNQNLINCIEITGADISDPQQADDYFQSGGLERCGRLLSETAGEAAGMIWDYWQEEKSSQK